MSETAFYPTSGGQPHDTGSIAGQHVVDVYETNGEIFHVVDGTIESRDEVSGKIDWKRRHDHMQQHTGQHILSQALVQVCDIHTVGFAIGADWSTIVLERKPDRDSLQSIIDLANAVIDENRRIDILYPTAEELKGLKVRGDIPEKENLRIIRVDGFDWSPCGGTHCKSTSDVRLIHVIGTRKEKDTYRLEFVCGHRAVRISQQNAIAVEEIADLFDAGPAEIVSRARSLLEKTHTQEHAILELRDARLQADCERMLGAAEGVGKGIIAESLDGRTTKELRQLGHLLVERPGIIALLTGRDAAKLGIVFARSVDRDENMNELLKRICDEVGCRGGGNPSFATGGGGADVNADAVLEAAKKALQ